MANLVRTWVKDGQKFESVMACENKCLNGNVPSCVCLPIMAVRRRLGDYEATGYEPEEIMELLRELDKLRRVMKNAKV